jgi:hypothetical protein
MGRTRSKRRRRREEHRKLRTTLAFMCGLGREAMPQDVFFVVMDLLMPSWNPFRRKDAGEGQPLPQQHGEEEDEDEEEEEEDVDVETV